ncbi:diguanylate cyclase [Luteimonas sp. MC1895]|uniref:diguanylate cyclase n=1 Tax=Luteimonas sp. MC1895 TaxID=2819513 RepID=UPI0018F0BCC3|nr:diguanylate cyclase [Luteimonas sp. MC1895]MBJ6978165.1 diguanylate cyclase [Luteimonas sp. MC1895]
MHPTDDEPVRQRELRFARRVHHVRTLGAALSALLVASVLARDGAPAWTWTLWAFNGFLWPLLAHSLTLRSSEPAQSAQRFLVFDSAAAGMWIAIMQFNLVPSAVLLAMVSMDKIAVGGWRFLGRTTLPLLAACALTSTALGFAVRLESSMSNVLATLPFLFVYPIALATLTYGLGRSVALKNRQLERLNRVDVVTGLLNRRGWNETLGAELARHARTRRPAVLMLVDVDGFKAVNERHGHLAGDAVLRSVSSVLRACTREIDAPARYGGDKFGVLLAETSQAGALRVAERVRTAFLAERTAEAAAEGCTLSIGLAQADLSVVTTDEWLTRADTAMYRAKAGGRNRVEPDGTLAGQLY